ncbi:MAG: xanthine dehydrogenase family protein molybdopterin-binding subunit [Alphaproteobacteria bacterium]|nr:xanthine dehydrogenase family protein molybdopterin-binding subunit [Alphaproteobacteria bacterium]
MAKFGVGQPVRRVEDARLLKGIGQYTDDISLKGQAHAFVLRSPHAHAAIKGLDAGAARAMPGVLAVLTAKELAADRIGAVHCKTDYKNIDGSTMFKPDHNALASDRVRHVGDPVALVVAETLAQARDAAEAVQVDYEVLPAIVDTAGALKPGAPRIWPQYKNNLVLDWQMGNAGAVEAEFKKAKRIVKLDLVNNRIVVNAMEPRAAIGEHDARANSYTLRTCSQGVHGIAGQMAEALGVDVKNMRVMTGDVGGGFGMKIFAYVEHVLVLWAAKRVGRPVRWTADRGESFLCDTQGRDHVSHAELAVDADNRFLAIKVSTVANLGAYLSNYGPFIPTDCGSGLLVGVYAFKAAHASVKCVTTNTVPVDAYRGAGRPEAAYLVERLVDLAAIELGTTPDALRAKNFIPRAAMPFKQAMGLTYDSGDFNAAMATAMKEADWAGFPARKAASKARGKLRGIGMSYYVEACGGQPNEKVTLVVNDDETVALMIGNQSNGQGHETAYSQLVSEGLGVPLESIKVVQGDTALIDYGMGTGGSRALPVGGVATNNAIDDTIAKAKDVAADALEAARADIEFADGQFRIAGTDRSIGIFEVAKRARAKKIDLKGLGEFTPPAATFPNGCHVCELEVDPDTGQVALLRMTMVDDFGRIINPLLLAGQVHGGVAQGVGQALLERTVYDSESGQLTSGSLMDYALPRASDVPSFTVLWNNQPCTTNPLGIKGAGEAGAIGAPPAIINAIVNALGIKHIDMPATPERVWRAANGGRQAAA